MKIATMNLALVFVACSTWPMINKQVSTSSLWACSRLCYRFPSLDAEVRDLRRPDLTNVQCMPLFLPKLHTETNFLKKFFFLEIVFNFSIAVMCLTRNWYKTIC